MKRPKGNSISSILMAEQESFDQLIIQKRFMKKTRLITVIHSLLLIISVLFAIIYLSYDLNPQLYLMPLAWGLVISFIWMIFSWRIFYRQLFDPYILFLIAATVFNAGFAFIMVGPLGDKTAVFNFFNYKDIFSVKQIVDTFLLVLISLLAFHFGALINNIAFAKFLNKPKEYKEISEADRRKLRQIGWGVFIIALIPTLVSLSDAFYYSTLFGYKEGWIQRATVSAPIRILSAFFIPGVLFILASSKEKRFSLFISIFSLLLYSGIYFYIGARRFAVSALLAGIWTWDRCIRRLPRMILLIAGVIVLFVIIPLISYSRNTPGFQYFNLISFINQSAETGNLIRKAMIEMGRTSQIITFTMDLVPDVRPFANGQSYLNSLASIIPNLFWDNHPTAEQNLSQWFVAIRFPEFAKTGGGFGFSMIAEAYLNFGWIGTPIVLAILGFLYAKFVVWASRNESPLRIATVASFMSFFLLFTRGESYLLPRYLVWYSFLPYLLVQYIPVIKLNSKKKA